MSCSRAFVLGILTAFASVFALLAATRLFGEREVLFLALPGLGLVVAGCLAGPGWRLVRGVVGAVLAVVAAIVLIHWLVLRGGVDLGDPLLGEVLAGLAGACGAMAASAESAGRGLALAAGYVAGYVALMIPALLIGGDGVAAMMGVFALVLGLGAAVGGLLGALVR